MNSSVIELMLPYPPSVNNYWLQSKRGRYISKRGVAFRQAVAELACDAKVQALEGRLSVHIALFPPDKRVRDVDNVLKSLLDACEHAGCYRSDSQIDELHIIRQPVRKGGGCTVIILTIDRLSA